MSHRLKVFEEKKTLVPESGKITGGCINEDSVHSFSLFTSRKDPNWKIWALIIMRLELKFYMRLQTG